MDKKMYKVEVITKPERLDELKEALNEIGVTGMTVYEVEGCGAQRGHKTYYRGVEREISLLPKIKMDVVVSEIPVEDVIEAIESVLRTGNIGDGKIFVTEVYQVVRIRTGERGWDALQDV